MHDWSTTALLPGLDRAARRGGAGAGHAYRELKRRILTCRIAPGQRINEKALAVEFGVRRSDLCEACDQLVREQLLLAAKRDGFTVAGFSLADVRELCELRRIVESKVAALAAERVQPAQTARLLALAEQNYRPGQRETYEPALHTNLAFHQLLAGTTGNRRLEAVVASVLGQMQRPLFVGFDVGAGPNEVTAEHLQIVDAVRRKRPTLAYQLMWDHMADSEKEVLTAWHDNGFA